MDPPGHVYLYQPQLSGAEPGDGIPDDTPSVIGVLTKDIEAANERQRTLDKEAYRYFLDVTANKDEVRRLYELFQSISRRYSDFANLADEMLNGVQPLYEGGLTREQVHGIIRTIKAKYEPGLNKAYRSLT